MSSADLVPLLPFLILSAALLVALILVSIRRSHGLTAAVTLIGLALAFVSTLFAGSPPAAQVTPLLIIDPFARFFIGLITAASFAIAGISYAYLKNHDGNKEEYYLLLLSATLGSAVLTASTHFATFFIGLEILSISLYALIAYQRLLERNIEAGVKYLILAGASSAFLLFGMALVYAALGTMQFSQIAAGFDQAAGDIRILVLAGVGLITVGIGFKLAVVPFHMWTPDVYEGAPAPVTAFVATISKGSMFALLIRLFAPLSFQAYPSIFVIFSVIAIASMIAGNLLALLQNNVKRILAYSSIAHLGYLLVAFLASGKEGITAATFYLVAYFVTTLAAFGVITAFSGKDRDADALQDYQGLFWRHPWLAALMAGSLFSLAGIPLTAGFIGKFFLVRAGVGSALWPLVFVLVLSSVIGLYYYLRVVFALFAQTNSEGTPALEPSVQGVPAPGVVVSIPPSLSLGAGLILAVLGILLVWIGVYPAPFLQLIQAAAASFG